MNRHVLSLIAAGRFLTGTAVGAEEPVTISVKPRVTTCQGNARLKVIVPRDDKNRLLVWEVDGPNYYRSSTIELQGAAAPRSHFFLVRGLPAGEYEVRATIRRQDATQAIDRTDLTVVGGPE
jgi:hypothetical protein